MRCDTLICKVSKNVFIILKCTLKTTGLAIQWYVLKKIFSRLFVHRLPKSAGIFPEFERGKNQAIPLAAWKNHSSVYIITRQPCLFGFRHKEVKAFKITLQKIFILDTSPSIPLSHNLDERNGSVSKGETFFVWKIQNSFSS